MSATDAIKCSGLAAYPLPVVVAFPGSWQKFVYGAALRTSVWRSRGGAGAVPGVTISWPAHLPGTSRGIRVVKVSGTALPILADSIQIHYALHSLPHVCLNAPALIFRRLDRTARSQSLHTVAAAMPAQTEKSQLKRARVCLTSSARSGVRHAC